MDVIKNLKKLKVEHVILFLVGAVFLFYLIKSYSTSKVIGAESMNSRKTQEMFNQSNASQSGGNVEPSQPLGQNETYASATGMSTSTQGLPPSCSRSPVADPSELLPKDTNSQWAQLNPSGKGELANVNLLKAGYHIGIDTVGQSLRNANLQIRSEPPNPQLNVGPWNQSTIESDFLRPPLEIGSGAQ